MRRGGRRAGRGDRPPGDDDGPRAGVRRPPALQGHRPLCRRRAQGRPDLGRRRLRPGQPQREGDHGPPEGPGGCRRGARRTTEEGEDDDGSLEPAELEDDRDELVERIRETTLRLLRQVDPRRLRLAFRQAGVELLHKADAAELADLSRRLEEPLPIDNDAGALPPRPEQRRSLAQLSGQHRRRRGGAKLFVGPCPRRAQGAHGARVVPAT